MPQKEYAAFTSTNAAKKVCQRCYYPTAGELFFMENTKPGKEGKWVCDGCHSRYQNETTARDTNSEKPNNNVNEQQIRNSNLAGNRSSNPFQSGPASQASSKSQAHRSMPPPPLLPHSSSQGRHHSRPPLPPPPPSSNSSGRSSMARGPQIYTPPNTSLLPSFPDLLSNSDGGIGYTEAHAQYEQMRQHFASKVFSQGHTQSITLKCWLARMEPRKVKQTLIHVSEPSVSSTWVLTQTQDIHIALANIPVNIGASELKRVVYYGLLPQIIKWLRDYPVSDIQFTLHKEHWVEVVPSSYPDVNAITDDFFILKAGRGGGIVRTFVNKNPAKLYLAMDNPTYDSIMEHFDKLDNPDEDIVQTKTDTTHTAKGKGKGKGVARGTKKLTRAPKREISPEDLTRSSDQEIMFTTGKGDVTPPRASKKQRTESNLMVSPEASHIKDALRRQGAPRSKALKPIPDNRAMDCHQRK
ncbi:hypothetical protein DFH07DRAFT_770787 [Mycena maculata]|uniref:Uncharacterized protein n=1 Tax=Mycena maculata TaxID=230809 RepID=A0AAD7JHQ0_9AGAR|nr:hypothetical protein DFH07DRAFT_770787 [Mycena maculata]